MPWPSNPSATLHTLRTSLSLSLSLSLSHTHILQTLAHLSVAEKSIAMGDQQFKKKFDTTKMSPEELKELNLEGARRPPGEHPGGVLNQQGGAGLSRAGRYPVVLAGVAVVVGISTLLYYRSIKAQSIPGKSNQALESNHPATAKAPSER